MDNEHALRGYASFHIGDGVDIVVWAPAVIAMKSIRETSYSPEPETEVYMGMSDSVVVVPLPLKEVAQAIEEERKGYEEWLMRSKILLQQKAGQSS